jgi:hypothetical protein
VIGKEKVWFGNELKSKIQRKSLEYLLDKHELGRRLAMNLDAALYHLMPGFCGLRYTLIPEPLVINQSIK